MIRMDSNAALSQTGSMPNIHEINRDASTGKLGAVGTAMSNFTTVQENDDESDMESTMQRVEPGEGSDEESVMERVVAASDASSVMQKVNDDATS